MELKLSLKDLVFILSLLSTAAGTWFSSQAKIRELELRQESDRALVALKLEGYENKFTEQSARIHDLESAAKTPRKK